MKTSLPSRYSIGDPVYVQIWEQKVKGNVRVIIFSNSKVRYSISIIIKEGEGEEESRTTFHNIDSVFVEDRPDGEVVDFGDDNYS